MKKVLIIGGIVLLALMAIPFLGTLTNVVTAPARVANDALKTDNVRTSYERFYDVHQNFQARVNQVRQFSGFMTSAGDDKAEQSRLRMEMAAQQQSCRELAADYNADSSKLTIGTFKGWDLPQTLDPSLCESKG